MIEVACLLNPSPVRNRRVWSQSYSEINDCGEHDISFLLQGKQEDEESILKFGFMPLPRRYFHATQIWTLGY